MHSLLPLSVSLVVDIMHFYDAYSHFNASMVFVKFCLHFFLIKNEILLFEIVFDLIIGQNV